MIRYKMFEKEITKGNHVSYHFCVDTFGDNFHPKSKHYPIDQALAKIASGTNLEHYEINMTTENTTSEGNYFHISYLMKNRQVIYLQKDVLKTFDIPVDFNVIYFTRAFPYVDGFKCGFDYNVYRSLGSRFHDDVVSIVKKFEQQYNAVIFAGDFTKDGEFIDDSINIEIIPYQHRKIYRLVKKVLLENYDVEKIHLYDKKFETYNTDDFAWHIKIKLYKDKEPVVKFYRTYPGNPYLNYGNYR